LRFESPNQKLWTNFVEDVWKCKKTSFPTRLRILFITFYWRIEISNGFLEIKFHLISQLCLVQSFLKKVVLLWLNEVWNFTANIILAFDLIMSGWASTHSNSHIPYGLCYLLLPQSFSSHHEIQIIIGFAPMCINCLVHCF